MEQRTIDSRKTKRAGEAHMKSFLKILISLTLFWSLPLLSAEGQILFASNREGTGSFELFTMNPDGSEIMQLTSDSANAGHELHARWSPDGQSIVFAKCPGECEEIWSMNSDGGNPQKIRSGRSPVFSPDGTQIAFSDYGGSLYGADALYLYDLATQQTSEIANKIGHDYNPDWSPDGKNIVFTNYFLPYYNAVYYKNLYSMDTESGTITQLTDYDDYSRALPDSAKWSPQGTEIIYTWRTSETDNLLAIMNSDGSNQRTLFSCNVGELVSSVWSPDGNYVLTSCNARLLLVKKDLSEAQWLSDEYSESYPMDWR